MITVLLGQDDLAKQKYVAAAAAKQKLELVKVRPGDSLPEFTNLQESALFGPAPAYVFENYWKDLDPEKLLEIADNPGQIFILEGNIDQRKTINKTFLKDKRIAVKEFVAPVGDDVIPWLKQHAEDLGVKIEQDALQALADALAPSPSELSVHRADNELQKLRSYAGGETVTRVMVAELVEPLVSINVFNLLDAIGTKNKTLAINLLEEFFQHTDGDEKAKAIQISALLADQLRNILLVQDAVARKLPENQLLEDTGWKTGRLFVMKKLARNLTSAQIKQTMAKLENLDLELKSSTMPPHVVLDLIISQM